MTIDGRSLVIQVLRKDINELNTRLAHLEAAPVSEGGGGGGGSSGPVSIVNSMFAYLPEAVQTVWSDEQTANNGVLSFKHSDGVQDLPPLSVPRSVIFRLINPQAGYTAGTLTIVGIDQRGEPVNLVVPFFGLDGIGLMDDDDWTTVFSSITSVTVANINPADNGGIQMYYGFHMGLPVPVDATDLEVFYTSVDGANAGVVDTDKASLSPTTQMDSVFSWQVYFRYTIPAA